MQMGYDFESGRQSAGSPGRIGGFAEPWSLRGEVDAAPPLRSIPGHPDWAGLRARFLAIHALRRALATSGPAALAAGSFADAAAAVLDSCREELAGVNLVYSANSKAAAHITGPVVGHPTPGDRGMQ